MKRSPLYKARLEPEATEAMVIAFEKAIAMLRNKSQPSEVIQVIAKRIMELGRQGERDPERLCEYGIKWMLDCSERGSVSLFESKRSSKA